MRKARPMGSKFSYEPGLHLHAAKQLNRLLELGEKRIELSGFDSPTLLAGLLTDSTAPGPSLVVLSSDAQAHELMIAAQFFSNNVPVYHLPSWDVSPYSGLYPSPKIIAQRVRWLSRINSAARLNGGAPARAGATLQSIFTATPKSLGQLTITANDLAASAIELRVGGTLPEGFISKLVEMGYQSAPLVEDVGHFSQRGAIVDIFSPHFEHPIRFETFGDDIESIRFFDPDTQRSFSDDDGALSGRPASLRLISIGLAREFKFDTEARERAGHRLKELWAARADLPHSESAEFLRAIAHGSAFPGIDFLGPLFRSSSSNALAHVPDEFNCYYVNPIELTIAVETAEKELLDEEVQSLSTSPLAIPLKLWRDSLLLPTESSSVAAVTEHNRFRSVIQVSRVSLDNEIDIAGAARELDEQSEGGVDGLAKPVARLKSIELKFKLSEPQNSQQTEVLGRVSAWRAQGLNVIVGCSTESQSNRLRVLLESRQIVCRALSASDFNLQAAPNDFEGRTLEAPVLIVPRRLPTSFRLPDDNLVLLREDDFFGSKSGRKPRDQKASSKAFRQATDAVSFSDLKPGDRVVHQQHGIAIYEGLKRMQIAGIESEFVTLTYKDGDKLYVPIYRIDLLQKYSGPSSHVAVDRLGSQAWAKTKSKVRSQLREIAAELLKLYAQRAECVRQPITWTDTFASEYAQFEGAFPFDETDDQLTAIEAIQKDLTGPHPMDRLICGDVGFGKTEVAMRAAFMAAHARRQVIVLAPTTVLSFQHLESFQKRFKGWPLEIRALNRFISPAEQRKILTDFKNGQVDILIGTHRVLSRDVEAQNLGLLIIDEEQRFGVTHKERIKLLRTNVDTLTLSATPIPRTLNMSLVGIRDLSLINTPPVDRLPTRTFVAKFDEETIRKGIISEISRGGQVFFLHNRVQTIFGIADQIRRLVPDARVRVGHGQMEEHELERTMIAFFKHEVDVLVSTTIIESGIDNPKANTMFIDNADQLGLSQLYQLRGRVGRAKERAFCYLLVPPNKKLDREAQERLKVIQENTALGSGITIAHHDLELRGAGNLLGEDQSGQAESVGYEMYLELLQQAVAELKGEPTPERIEPDINVRIPALIPEDFIPDLRIRLSWYRRLSHIQTVEDVDREEEELRDQYGRVPEPVLNLLGLMLIRSVCRELGVKDLSSGPKSISLLFTTQTPLPPAEVVRLATSQRDRMSLSPEMRLSIRMDPSRWPDIYQALLELKALCPNH